MSVPRLNLLISNYAMSSRNPTFSHQIEAVIELAKKFNEIYVLTREINQNDLKKLPKNVYVKPFLWKNKSPVINTFRFWSSLINIYREKRVDLNFFHMTEVESILALPITKYFAAPSVLWYAHVSKSKYLQMFNIFGNRILTSTPGSCPLISKKIVSIGQGINKNLFYGKVQKKFARYKFVHIGRLDSSKQIELLINTLAEFKKVFPKISLDLYGRSDNESYLEYLEYLVQKNNKEFTNSWVTIKGPIIRERIPVILKKYDVFIHAFRGSLDKSLLEAAMFGKPVITINKEFAKEFRGNQVEYTKLADQINYFLNASNSKIHTICSEIQKKIIEKHSLQHWVSAVYKELMQIYTQN